MGNRTAWGLHGHAAQAWAWRSSIACILATIDVAKGLTQVAAIFAREVFKKGHVVKDVKPAGSASEFVSAGSVVRSWVAASLLRCIAALDVLSHV